MSLRTALVALGVGTLTVPLALAAPAAADSDRTAVGFGQLFYDGQVVRTVATPTSQPGRGVDTIYAFADGASGQLSVTSVVPGDRYHGGRWAVYLVDWVDSPSAELLTSDEVADSARAPGDVTVTRAPAADFVCPVTRAH